MFSLENDTDVVVCPYNKAHRLLRKRLQSHLIKCRKNYPQLELQKCPFNVTHHIPEPEFALHVTNCPDRKLITQYKYDTVEVKEEERVKHAPVECDENWDDTEVDDYDPQKFIDKKNVLRKPYGVPPAERKKFIKSERIRLGDDESYSDSDEDAEAELEKLVQAMKNESASADNEAPKDNESDATIAATKRQVSASPEPQKAKSSETKSKSKSRSRSRSRSRSPQSKKHRRTSRSKSRSPVNSAFYRRIHGRDSASPQPPPAPRYKEPSFIRERSPINTNRNIIPTTDYNIDDDPYYSGSSSSTHNNYGTGRENQQNNHMNYPGGAYTPSAYVCPPFVAYPTRMPTYGRGGYRGYPYDRRTGYRHNDLP